MNEVRAKREDQAGKVAKRAADFLLWGQRLNTTAAFTAGFTTGLRHHVRLRSVEHSDLLRVPYPKATEGQQCVAPIRTS